jgi:hypothetical protein
MKNTSLFILSVTLILQLVSPPITLAICYEERGERKYVWDPVERNYGYKLVTYQVPVPCDEEELNNPNCYFETQSLITSTGDPVVEDVFVCDE